MLNRLGSRYFADVPDMSMIRVGNVYSEQYHHAHEPRPSYHEIGRSGQLGNHKLCLQHIGRCGCIESGKWENAYGGGSWASCFVIMMVFITSVLFRVQTIKTYIYTTNDIEKGPWDAISFAPAYHDHTLFFDDDGRIYMIWGAETDDCRARSGSIGSEKGTEKVLIENARCPAGSEIGLGAEGSQLFK